MKRIAIITLLFLATTFGASAQSVQSIYTVHVVGTAGVSVWIEGTITKPDGATLEIARQRHDLPYGVQAGAENRLRLRVSTDDQSFALTVLYESQELSTMIITATGSAETPVTVLLPPYKSLGCR